MGFKNLIKNLKIYGNIFLGGIGLGYFFWTINEGKDSLLNIILIWILYLVIFCIVFSSLVARINREKFYNVLYKDMKTYLPYSLLLLLSQLNYLPLPNSTIYPIFLFIIISGIVLFLKAKLINWKLEEKIFPVKTNIVPYTLLLILIIIYIFIYSYLSISKYQRLYCGIWDVGIFDQVLWNTLNGKILHSDILGYNFLGEHMCPILLFIAPLYLLWEDVRILFIFQSTVLGLGALPVYLLARDKLKNNFIALCFSTVYLLHPFISRINLFEFHPECLGPLFLLFTFYFLHKKNYKLYFLFLVLSLLIKENFSLIIMGIGVYMLFIEKEKKIGLITVSIGILWAFLSVPLLMQWIRQNTATITDLSVHSHAISRYYHIGKSFSEIINNLIFNPQILLSLITSYERWLTIIILLLPVGFLSIFSIWIFLIPLLDILLNFLSSANVQYLLLYHYSAGIIPFILISAIYGFNNIMLNKRFFKKIPNKNRFHLIAIPLSIYVLTCGILSNYYLGYPPSVQIITDEENYQVIYHKHLFSISPILHTPISKEEEYQNMEVFYLIKELIPNDTPVSVSDAVGAHFTQRTEFYPLKKSRYKEANYILINGRYDPNSEECSEILTELLKDKEFQLLFRERVFSFRGFFLFARNGYEKVIISKAEETVRKIPNSPFAHLILGSIYYNINMLDKAIIEYQKGISLNPHIIDLHKHLGVVYITQGNLKKAIEKLKYVLRLKPNDMDNKYIKELLDKLILYI